MEKFTIKGKTILVTGGGRGIGREIVRALVVLGAKIIIVGRNQNDLDQVAEDHPGQITCIQADLSNHIEVDRVIHQVSTEHPELSCLINNAGVQFEMDLLSGDRDSQINSARTEIAVNVEAVVSLTFGLIHTLKTQPQAVVVNISSGFAIGPNEKLPIYSAGKAFIRSLSTGLRYQCQKAAPEIQILDVVLDLVETDMTRASALGGMPPYAAAAAIVTGIQQGKSEIWVGRTKFLRMINLICPPLARKILRG